MSLPGVQEKARTDDATPARTPASNVVPLTGARTAPPAQQDTRTRPWWRDGLDEFTHCIEIVIQLSITDFKTRHFQRALSYVWWFLEPLMMAFTFFWLTMVLGGAGRAMAGTYAEIFMGVVLWQWFRTSCSLGMTALTGSAGVLKMISFPPLVLIFSKLLTEFMNLLLSLFLVLGILLLAGAPIGASWLHFPIGVACQLLFTVGLVIWLSMMGVFVRDTLPIVNFGLTLLMYVSPIVFRAEKVPAAYAGFLFANPFTAFMRVYTNTLIDGKPIDNWGALAIWSAISLVMLVTGLIAFQAARKKFYRFL
jgi:lipopolysaccharide transport system permease protein